MWQDGGLLIRLNGRWIGIFLAFQSQAWHTDDATGHAIDGAAAAGRRGRAAIRILAAMVNPNGGAPERETVLLLNASPQAVDLTGWPIADRMKQTCALPPAAGRRPDAHRDAGQRRPARQQGRLDHCARPRGLKVAGVAYTPSRRAREVWTCGIPHRCTATPATPPRPPRAPPRARRDRG